MLIKYTGKYVKIYFIIKITYLVIQLFSQLYQRSRLTSVIGFVGGISLLSYPLQQRADCF